MYNMFQHIYDYCFVCMQLVNHTIPDEVLDCILKGFSDFCDPKTIDERKVLRKRGPSDKIRWDLNSSAGENREYLKVIAHPQFHAPSNPPRIRYTHMNHYIYFVFIVFLCNIFVNTVLYYCDVSSVCLNIFFGHFFHQKKFRRISQSNEEYSSRIGKISVHNLRV